MRGQLPNPQRRRRNAPTIPTTNLPAGGRPGPVPRPPKSWPLGKAGTAWWRWAWRTPQAAAWSTGDLFVVARRASLEDDVAALSSVEGLDAVAAFDALDNQSGWPFRELIQRLAALATSRVTLLREARELDDRLGLTPKALAQLRWSIQPEEEPRPATGGEDKPPRPRLRAVDSTAKAG